MSDYAPVTVARRSTFAPPPRAVRLQRKCSCGTHSHGEAECGTCAGKRHGVQRRLAAGSVHDALEREADRIADRVTASPASVRGSAVPAIQRYAIGHAASAEVPDSVGHALAGAGAPLPADVRQPMEERFGHDFSTVRVHTDATARQSARDVDAQAYTVGHDVVFAAGRYAPHTREGRHLLAHELTHVVQQAQGTRLQRKPDDKPKPADKDKAAPANFKGCNDDRRKLVESAIKRAGELAARALVALNRDFPMSWEGTAMNKHFGSLPSSDLDIVKDRFKRAQGEAASKAYTCAPKDVKSAEGGKILDPCAEAECPGSKITIYPQFGSETCKDAGAILLHEVIHNLGGCGDTDVKDKNYPTLHPEDNAYSYEHYAVDVAAGAKAPDTLKKRDPQAPKARL
ncbi:DUF4157 domain-containing protein [Rhodanobacter sp. LX-100]|nr:MULTISPECIES: DUF4157 domain-containing protein [unclassified Rhodanobacter]MBT2142559.1 DUF4157 domain-containing protein [Rhodanobacter sp. LX-99]MBT2148368.1 DUF4157 domain-containing protein [Rhodanobacter sp. LX-100]